VAKQDAQRQAQQLLKRLTAIRKKHGAASPLRRIFAPQLEINLALGAAGEFSAEIEANPTLILNFIETLNS
jgi:hypothetical protein